MKNRILSIILTLLMLVSAVSMISIPAAAASFEIEPIVLLGGDDEYNIVWRNDFAGTGYITYTYNGKTYTVYDEENGVVRGADKMHSVRVPQAHIHQNRSYTIHATNGSTNFTHTVTGFNGLGSGSLDIGLVSDTHFLESKADTAAMVAEINNLFQSDLKAPELRVLVGDIVDSLNNSTKLDTLYKILAKAGSDGGGSAGHYPVLYVVGNHEKRGAYVHDIDKYLSYNTGEMYGYFEFGDAAFYVTDIGEDKADNHPAYTQSLEDPVGLIDMRRYYAEQYEYFESHKGYSQDKTYTFTISHAPYYVGADQSTYKQDFMNLFDKYGTDLHMFGHNHTQTFYDGVTPIDENFKLTTQAPEKNADGTYTVVANWNNTRYPGINIAASGAYTAKERGVLLSLSNNTYTFKALNEDGNQNWTASVNADANGRPPVKEETEEVLPEDVEVESIDGSNTTVNVPTAAGIPTGTLKAASATSAITSAPVVFDAGKYYNIVWRTSSICAGYVDVTGASKAHMDQYAGILRHTKRETTKIHSVRIPKSSLDGKTYSVKNRAITSNYICGFGNYVTDKETGETVLETYTNQLKFGAFSFGGAVDFVSQPTKDTDKYTVLAVGGNFDPNTVKAQLDVVPNLVVVTGDAVSALNTEDDFAVLLNRLGSLTGGNTPIMLLRGAGESTGNYAAELPTVLHNFASVETMNKMYTTSNIGKLSVIGLDTAKSGESFDVLRAEQVDWLANELSDSFASKYNLAFANKSNAEMEASFAKHGVQLSVVAGNTSALTVGENTYSRATVAANDALIITCVNGEIDVKSALSGELDTIENTDITYAVAKIGDKYYKTLDDAITATKNADTETTITLTADVVAKHVRVRAGVTLDLNGHKLTATSVTGFDESNIVDSNVTATSGIYVAKNRLTVAEDNAELPIYDKANGCYMFTTVDLSYTYYDEDYSSYNFAPELLGFDTVEGTRANALLKQNSADTGVQIIVHLDWETQDYFSSQDFNYKPTYLEQYFSMAYADQSYWDVYFFATFAGDALKQADSVTVTSLVKSDRGYSIASESTTFTY